MNRSARVVFGAFAFVACGCLLGRNARDRHIPVPQELTVDIPMEDGVRLAADVIFPPEGRRWPVVLVRTPYGRKAKPMLSYRYFRRRGYVVAIEDVRGRYESQGLLTNIQQEGPDGRDTVEWIAQQPWCDGRVVMAGSSYLGITQWWAAVEKPEHLAAISPMSAGDDDYTDRFYSPGGGLQLAHRLSWVAENLTPPGQVRPLFSAYTGHIPLVTADIAATGLVVPIWRTAVAHPSDDTYWRSLSIREKLNQVTAPVLSFGGWFDEFVESDLDAFSRLAARHATIETWIGPWAHNPATRFPTLNFGPGASLPFRLKQSEWFDRWAKKSNESSGVEPGRALLHIFVMGPNVWREEHEWPLARRRMTSLYLASKGHANSNAGDGRLVSQPIRKSGSDQFTYDPRNPVATRGGAVCCDPLLLPPGPLDQSGVEMRPDVLVYTSNPLPNDIEVTGPIRVVLFVSTSANDTDFTAKLVDVEPNGRPLLITDGIQRLRYRLSLAQPIFVRKNQPYEINIDAGVTSYVFAAGHRIRVEISSSNFPRFDRNMNSVKPNAFETKFTKARQTVLHDPKYPSAVLLPVIPNGRRG